ncbi:tyrosine-protein phosphatase [Pedobacter sp. AW31-3R]|uniref:tyrosine-protein phosphatase n=1 Tax=Pedobacter sp. AW31-3R TaxID=3445781 RepID=UPI003FA06D6C
MFSIFRKKTPIIDHVNWLGVDIHSHLLPGIDDGSADLEQSMSYIRKLNNFGFEKLICTPHIFKDFYPNTPATIFPVLESVKSQLKTEGISVEMGAAAEYMIDDGFEMTDELLCLKDRYVLIEMSYLSETPDIEQVIFDLQVKGYQIVLAHPERYNFYHANTARYQRLKEMGCLFQLNLLSIVGYYGKSVKVAAEYLLQQKLYDLAGTDMHHDKHMGMFSNAVKSGKLYQLLGNYEFKNKELFL